MFAGGDAVLGPASFVQAVAQGRQAAQAIHNYLQYGHLRMVEPKEKPVDPEVTAEERARAKPIERQQMPALAPEVRKTSYAEVELGFSARDGPAGRSTLPGMRHVLPMWRVRQEMWTRCRRPV